MYYQKLICFLMISLVVCLQDVCAQQWAWQRDDRVLNPSGLDLEGATSWAWGDLDNDDIADVVVRKNGQAQNSRLEFWRGVLRESPPYWEFAADFFQEINDAYFSEGVSLADLDGDGKLNLITYDVRNSQWKLLYWNRDANGKWLADSTIFAGLIFEPPYTANNDPAFADVDQDGDLDMILIDKRSDSFSQGKGFRFFENVGRAEAPAWYEDNSRVESINHFLPGFDVRSAVLMEANGDSFTDLVVEAKMEFEPSFFLYPGFQDSSATGWGFEFVALPLDRPDRGTARLWSVDLNDDGYQDLLQLELEGSGRLFLADKSSESHFAPDYFRTGPMKSKWNASVNPIDYNQDGSLDLLTIGFFYDSGFQRLVHSYEKEALEGRQLWRNTHWFSLNSGLTGGQYKVALVDLEQNSLLDYVASDENVPLLPRPFVLTYENTAPNLQGNWIARNERLARFRDSTTDTVYFDPSFSDLDGDGDADLLITELILTGPDSGNAQHLFFENRLDAGSITWEERPNWLAGLPSTGYSYGNFADLDLDGDPDLIFAGQNGELEFYENTGSRKQPSWRADPAVFAGVDVDSLATPSFADLDGDGRQDLLVGNAFGTVRFYHNESVVSAEDESDNIPGSFHLRQNYPNPFNPETTIEYEIAEAGQVRLSIYNLLGQRVRTLVDEWQVAGPHRIFWDGNSESGAGLSSGIYFYELQVGEKSIRRRMLLLR